MTQINNPLSEQIHLLRFAVFIDMFDADREAFAGSGFHLCLGKLKQGHRVETGLGRQDTFFFNLSCSHKHATYSHRYACTLTHALTSRRHREDISVLSAVL